MNFATKSVLLAATAMSAAYAMPAFAQDSDDATAGNDIIVTARRVEEKLQDVPISITVFSQESLTKNNVQTAKDIATYTPGLTTLNRNGENSTSFAVRGFVQERGTTATVGTYFNDVVAPRGSGGTTGGDGAGPGAFFDLQNVQVLKGPQGTLQGRNSTGGAVLLVPRKPTDKLEGYLEGSAGAYGLMRVEGVINLPVSDSFRLRFGVDHNKRDGYQKNIGNLGNGPHGKDMASRDYWALRLSAVLDVTPDIENYTVASYTNSKSSGNIARIFACTRNVAGVPTIVDPVTRLPLNGATGAIADFATGGINGSNGACSQMVREAATPWTVSNAVPTAKSDIESWQVNNTTSWRVSDNLTIKNIFSYAQFRQTEDNDFFGTYFPIAGVAASAVTSPTQINSFVTSTSDAVTGYNNAQSTLVEELQFQGNSANGRFVWQAGLYLEDSKPLGFSGTQSNQLYTPCADPAQFNCLPFTAGISLGSGTMARFQNSFNGKAAYGQASYDLTETLKVTAGIRYTKDKTVGNFQLFSLSYRGDVPGPAGAFVKCSNASAPGFNSAAAFIGYPVDQRFGQCQQNAENSTSATTWLLGLDYKPIDNVLLYAKWSRGYRQGGVFISSPDTLQGYGAEKVDTYEVGAKTSWRGAVPGTFNISGFYNDFRDQQLQIGVNCIVDPTHTCVGATLTTAVANVGKSRLYGFEAELGLTPFEGFNIHAAYAYLNTKIISFSPFVLPANSIYNEVRNPSVGDPIPSSLPHKLNLGAEYTLPLPESIGKVSIGGTFVYQSRYKVSVPVAGVPADFGFLPSASYGNINVNWDDVGGMPVDLAFFMTNVTNQAIRLHVNEQSSRGFLSYVIGEPRIWGVRLKYRFGN